MTDDEKFKAIEDWINEDTARASKKDFPFRRYFKIRHDIKHGKGTKGDFSFLDSLVARIRKWSN